MTEEAPDVFVSYKREDQARVVALVDRLRAEGLNVWWDADIPGGAPWRPTILEQLDRAKCAIVVWSDLSVGTAGEFVHEEASRAKARNVLLPLRIDRVVPPLGFGETQSLDLVGWSGRADERFYDVLNAVRAIVAGEPRPHPRQSVGRMRWRIGAIAAAGLALIGFAANVSTLQNGVCRIAGLHAVCARYGIGGVASAAEENAWTAAQLTSDCAALRDFITRFAEGVHAAEADRRLRAARKETEQTWRHETVNVPLFLGSNLRAWPTENAARADAIERGQNDAKLACAGFASNAYRLRDAKVDPSAGQWNCQRNADGTRCSFTGRAICEVDARSTIEHEICK